MKQFFSILPFFLLFGACTGGPDTVSELSREEAIRLYNGGIAEAEWLAKLNLIPYGNSAKLSDGFLFYKTEDRDGTAWITEIVPPVDAPAEMKALARSFRSRAEPTKEIHLKQNAIWLDGNIVTEDQLLAELQRLQGFPRSRRPNCRLIIEKNVDAATQSRIAGALKKSGITVE